MIPSDNSWQPLPVSDIQVTLGDFNRWVLCGGCSIDWLLDKTTREHADTDIGIFRSELICCLKSIDQSRVFLCDPPGQLVAWNGIEVPAHVHDIWITNKERTHWVLQLMVYDDHVDTVIYRRDPRLTWPKSQHAISIRGVKILNPVVTLLFKLHRQELRDKDCHDVSNLIEYGTQLLLAKQNRI
ncbi:hypothetical protein [Gimesia sp.]|uniref:hypothetical protein n=1 Tax=Gimesia sp. TaxID=2024833 RepID=UPI000C4474E2|nr:hypothetical protein [Gimesia sp.]MAX38935.1 hypothetical protein [Gimesia sp.]HAH49189.1 hypothetical protein [Planctomycetaceae bacterium]HBL47779.1 hypothetical protein [Planctomycetaceae bacterium]|tara:strand:- start:6548 stop:7099 length:552 start_codon:yes stop_codon:yes gene_type:complete